VKYSEMKDLTVDELRRRLQDGRRQLFETKMKHSLGQIASPITIRDIRRDCARIQTALTQKLSR